ncbi:hypothetical protein LCGC14_1250150 [marine sediment metagenome]|uniref:Protein kinase domain-containing protein n=1 Tax=marine sediment metagenome TaxID=412755 RepID=A0A0F9LQ74_9ZZZZ
MNDKSDLNNEAKIEAIVASVKELYGDKEKEFKKEGKVIEDLVRLLQEKLEGRYEIIKAIGIGGSAVIFKVKDRNLHNFYALKLPRPKAEKQILIDSIKNEMNILSTIKHENLISIYYADELDYTKNNGKYPYYIMDYIEDAQDLEKAIKTKIEEVNSSEELNSLLEWLANIIFGVAKATLCLHKNNIIHFDIKPKNILIKQETETDIPLLSDLGFAKFIKSEDRNTNVGFTLFYAHRKLRAEYQHGSSKNKISKEMKYNDFEMIFDIFALGKSILELLSIIYSKFSRISRFIYHFAYLHLMACRMLDGENMTLSQYEKNCKDFPDICFFFEEWRGLNAFDFEKLKYNNIEEVIIDLRKLIFPNALIRNIPELDVHFPSRIQNSLNKSAPFSQRMKFIVDHPIFLRLKNIPQLTLVNTVYPTANHNRFEHSLGAFEKCCDYVLALYKDPYNPLFRQLINEEKIKAVLLASLLHDLGQYPFAHTIEELYKVLNHENFTQEFLDSNIKGDIEKTLKMIIKEFWGISIELIKNILIPQNKEDLIFGLLHSIIDSPIDVDKIDYLIRDSINCNLPYGLSIDTDRIIRNLTVIIDKSGNKTRFYIGLYEKAQTAAESLIFARYMLYQSLYWHHTVRSYKSMIKTAIKSLDISKVDISESTFIEELKIQIMNNINIDENKVLDLIQENANDFGFSLIEMVKKRKYFKRIFTIHDKPTTSSGQKTFLEKYTHVLLKDEKKFKEELEKIIKKRFNQQYDTISISKLDKKTITLSEKRKDNLVEKFEKNNALICDYLEPSYGAKDEIKIRLVILPKTLSENDSRINNRISEVYNNIHYNLMNICTKGRVFCTPKIRNLLFRILNYDIILECISEAINNIA